MSSILSTISSIGGMTKSILVATGITKALSTAWNMVSSSTGDAIDRFDKLNAFPKTMKSLGISTEQSEKSINKLSEKLKGLPTTLDAGASAVARFTAKNEDIERSTEMFLAVNNAIIAGGAPMENQTAALEQMIQAYSKGKPDMMEWRTLMTAMPGQLKQVAKAMGYVSTDELHDALMDGVVSMDEFMDTVIRLDQEGGEGFLSFSEQAQNAVGGIKTAITNMKTAITRGVANIIDSLDKGLKEGGMDKGIYGIISEVGSGFEKGLTEIGKLLGENLSGLLSGKKSFGEVGENLTNFLLEGLTKGLEFLKENIPTVVPKLVEFLTGVLNALGENLPTLVPLATEVIVALVEALTTDENVEKLSEAGVSLGEGLIKGIKNTLSGESGGSILQTLAEQGIGNLANTFLSFGLPIFTRTGRAFIVGLFTGIMDKLGASDEEKEKAREELQKFIDKPLEFFLDIGKQLIEGLWNGIKEALGIKKPGKDIKKEVKENVGSDADTWLYGVGKDIVQGLINGLIGMYNPLWNAANTIAGIVSGVVKKKNEIHSPSKLFEYYGEMIGEGYINGIDKMKDAISQTAMDTFSISPQLANSMSLNNSPNVIVNNSINMETDPLGQTVSQIKTFAGGAKNDYNYGMGV